MARRVGVEIEFSGLDFNQASEAIGGWLEVEPEVVSPHEHEFDTDCGAYRLEVDFELLKRMSREEFESDEDGGLRQWAVEVLDAVSRVATPIELVTPPLPESDLDRLVGLQRALEAAGAVGTGHSLTCAFGVHFNPEAELDGDAITAHLRAFVCLYDWLKARDETDLSRQVTPYIDPFPVDYERELLAEDFAPSLPELIDHYLEHNPTRNRALDLLPLFAEIDPERVAAKVDDDRINARPTYHYRLPNSSIGEPGWSVLDPWRDWLRLEQLAGDASRLAELCERRRAHLEQGVLSRIQNDWVSRCRELMEDR